VLFKGNFKRGGALTTIRSVFQDDIVFSMALPLPQNKLECLLVPKGFY
jgi:hypothetical protein